MSHFDLVIRDARLDGGEVVDIGVRDGRVASLGPRLECDHVVDAARDLVVPGLVDTHVHLDKSRIVDRYGPGLGATLATAIRETQLLKAAFTEDDIYDRAARTLRECLAHGTMTMRAHVEVDAIVGLAGFDALTGLAADHAHLIDVELCVFAQEGLTSSPTGQKLLREALERGAGALGGAPYADEDPSGQLDLVFGYAQEFGVPVDLHLDLSESPDQMLLADVCRRTVRAGLEGQVTVGHVTAASFLEPSRLGELFAQVADSGVAMTVLPATDLYLMGREASHAKPRGVLDVWPLLEHGVACSVATNNVLNAFTPYGDGSLVRMANLYANLTSVGASRLDRCFDLIGESAARTIGRLRPDKIGIGMPADIIGFQATSTGDALARVLPPRWGVKAGRLSFSREPVSVFD